MDDGAISDGIYAMKGSTYAPDFDMFLWGWGGDPDPDWMLSVFTSDQVGGGWSDCGWRNKAYDAAVAAQKVELDPQKRKELSTRRRRSSTTTARTSSSRTPTTSRA